MRLLRGKPLKLTDEVYVRCPTAGEVYDSNVYDEYLSLITTTSLDVADVLWHDHNIWYEDIKSEWEFFVQKCIAGDNRHDIIIEQGEIKVIEKNCLLVNSQFKNALNYFLGLNYEYVVLAITMDNNKQQILQSVEVVDDRYILRPDGFKFTEHFYNLLTQYLKEINWIKTDYDFTRGGTKRAKKYILEERYKKREHNSKKKEQKSDINLDSIISSLIVRGQPYDKIWDYPIYVIYDLYFRVNKLDNYNNTIHALHNGCIDTKKTKIDWDKINWSSVID